MLISNMCFAQIQVPGIIWERAYGGTQNEDLNTIVAASDGGYILGGSTESHNGDVQSGNFQSRDIWIIKIDTEGEIQWEKTYGGTLRDTFCVVNPLADGGYIIGAISKSNDGDVQSGNLGRNDVWIFKIDSLRNIVWEQSYGGDHEDMIKSIESRTDGGYVFAGNTRSGRAAIHYGDGGRHDYWIVKVDDDGLMEWERTYGSEHNEILGSFCKSPEGGYLLCGYRKPLYDDEELWIVKVDLNGNVEWEKTFGGSMYDNVLSAICNSTGDFVLGGITVSNDGDIQSGNHGGLDIWMIKIGSDGKLLWEKTFGGSGDDNLYSITNDSKGGLLLGGATYSNDGDVQSGNHGDFDFWIVNLDTSGEILWEKTFGGSSFDFPHCIVSVSQNDFIIGGITESNDGDIQSGNHGENDIWLLKAGLPYDIEAPTTPTGLVATNIDISSFDLLWDHSIDNIAIAGYKVFVDDALIGTTSNNSYSLIDLTSGAAYSVSVSAFDEAGNESSKSNAIQVATLETSISMNDIKGELKIHPNPTIDLLSIETNEMVNYSIKITSLNGQLLISEEVSGPIHTVDLSSFQNGIYVITVRSEDFVITRKVVKL